MSNLLASLRAASTALDAIQESAAAIQNNVANASTPGYARQRLMLEALPFDPSNNLSGGVAVGKLVSSRDFFAEDAVRHENAQLGSAQETAAQMNIAESAFSLSDSTGVTSRMDNLYSAFSAWTVAPNSTASKENILAAARDVATSFNTLAGNLQRAGQNAEDRLRTTLTDVGELAHRIQQHNIDIRNGGAHDAGVQASLNADIDQLSSLADIRTVWQKDGTATVLIGGQTPLVVGDRVYDFSVRQDPAAPPSSLAGATAKMQILDESGEDVTESMQKGGRMAGLLAFRNQTVPGYLGSAAGAGDLNRLAKSFADRVNGILTAGDASPVPLFTYSSSVSAAASIGVNPAIDASKLSAADPTTTPPSATGRALALAALANPTAAADTIDGISFASFMGKITTDTGRISQEATASVDTHKQMLAQAQATRDSISAVSLDQEAVSLVQTQRAYEASAKVVSALDEMTKIALQIGQS